MKKKLLLIRGVPGAGKTTEARKRSHYVFEADDYFVCNGIYKFVPEEISAAHKLCRDRVERTMSVGLSPIAVSNTFSQRWEMAGYYRLAEQYGYEVQEFVVDPGLSAEELAARNVHGVPAERIQTMMDRWER